MLSYTTRRNLFGDLCGNSASANLILADTLMNTIEKRMLTGRNWPFLERQYTLSTVADTVTVTVAAPGVFTLAAHGFVPNQAVYLSTTGALPTGLTAGTTYYVISAGLTADTFEVSTTIGGTAVTTTGTQSGTHTVKTPIFILPPYTRKPESVYVTIDNQRYTPKEVATRREWDVLNQTAVYSDSVTHYFIYDGTLLLSPYPTTANNIVTINARRIPKDLNVADYTTGTIDIITNGSVAVTGSGTSWSTSMEGRWIRITHSDTATAAGDGMWYEIAKVTSTTTLVLRKPYAGTSLTTGASATYAIAEVSLLPEPFCYSPVYEALGVYFTSVDTNKTKADDYKKMAKELENQMLKDFGSQANVVLDSGENETFINPNTHVTL